MILDWCFLENKSSSEGLLGSGYKTILQLKAHLQINCQPSLRIFALSFLPLPIAKRNVSLANCFPMDLNSSVKPLIETRKRSGTKIEDWGEHLPKLVSAMTFVHLKQPFGVYLIDIF